MRLLFVTPELTPYTDPSPTGDMCAALPKALRSRGHEVTILSPLYGFIDAEARGLARRLRKVEVELGSGPTSFTVYDSRSAAGVELLFLGHDELLANREAVPLEDGPLEDGVLFGAFCKAAIEVMKADEAGFDRVCCFDWQTALIPLLVKRAELDVPSVLTVSDVRRQGRFDREVLERLALPDELFSIDALEFHGKVCFLKGGVAHADRVTTVSPSYASEIVQYADGLEGVFRERGKDFTGIAGGVDVAVWNPATDAHLHVRFDPMDLSGKRRCKAALQREVGFPVTDDVPLIVVLGPLDTTSGLDVLGRIVSRLLRNDVQLLVVGEGRAADPALVCILEERAKKWPDRLQIYAEADNSMVHRALSAADEVFVPPSQEPGGSTQLRAHRYGALPIGLRAGALGDTVVDCDAKLTTGTGFLFDEASDDVVLATLQRGIGAFARRPEFERVRARAMRADQGWDRAAYLYERLYESTA